MEESDINSLPSSFHCFICTQKSKEIKTLVDLKTERSESQEVTENIFNLLCKSLKIKFKKNSWDFTKDSLPFCPSCTQVSKELADIQEQIQRLDDQFAEKVEEIKNLVISSEAHYNENKSPDLKDLKNEENETDTEEELVDERFEYFRTQVTGRARKKSSKRDVRKGNSSPSSVPPKFRLKNLKPITHDKLPEEPVTNSRRRSTRVKKMPQKVLPDLSESEDKEDVDHFEDSNNEPDDYKPDSDEIDSTDLKPVFEIKQEAQSESEEAFAEAIEPRVYSRRGKLTLSKSLKPSPSKITATTSMSSKISQKRKIETKNHSLVPGDPRKSKLYIGMYLNDSDEQEDERPKKLTDNSADSDEESSDYDDEGDKGLFEGVRKWKVDSKSGKLFYDGVEVFPVDTGLKCSQCDEIVPGDKKSSNKVRMKRHILLKHLEKFTCILCDKVVSCKKYLEMHVKMVHEKSVIIPCDVCKKPFTSVNAMRRHAWNHQNDEEKQAAIAAGKKQYGIGRKSETVKCGQCGKMCKGPYNLKRHEETHIEHSERMKHQCQICGALYSAPETLRSHIKLAHENNNRLQWLQCPHCPKKYPQPGRLEKHMRCHTGLKPHKCPECGTGFSQSTLLKVHMLKHKNLRPHQCEHCDMSFYRRYHLQRHTQVYHESAKPPTKKQPYRSENGTRKTPQKRTRKKIQTNDEEQAEPLPQLVNPLHQQQQQPAVPVCDIGPIESEELLGIPTDHDHPPPLPPTFNFTNNTSFPYSFSYSFQGTSSNGEAGLNQ